MMVRAGEYIGEACPRIVVVQAEGPLGHRDLETSVGAVPFVQRDQWFVTLVVKLVLVTPPLAFEKTLSPMVPAARAPMTGDVPSRFDDTDPELLDHASDFALWKRDPEIFVIGHARTSTPTQVIHATVRMTTSEKVPLFAARVVARAGSVERSIPLAAPYVGSGWAGAATRTAALADPRRTIGGYVPEDVDPLLFQAAVPDMRASGKRLSGDEVLLLGELIDERSPVEGEPTDRLFALPGLVPVVTIDTRTETAAPIEMTLDTLTIDTDRPGVTLLWRGMTGPLSEPEQLRRVVVSMERLGLERSESERMADTQRGHVRYAWTEEDARDGKAPPERDATLDFQRHLTWGEVAPEPRVPLEDYAKVSAEIAEWPDQRDRTLTRHGFDGDRWLLEERCWLERFAADAVDGRGELAAHYGELFLSAQDQLASPEELRRLGLHDYVALRLEMERSPDVADVLARAQVTLSQWMRLERRWVSRSEADPAVAAEIEAMERAMEDMSENDTADDDTSDEPVGGEEG